MKRRICKEGLSVNREVSKLISSFVYTYGTTRSLTPSAIRDPESIQSKGSPIEQKKFVDSRVFILRGVQVSVRRVPDCVRNRV